jgi:BA14K-like protein
MKKLVVALALITAVPSVTPAQAFPSMVAPKIEVQKAESVQWRHRGGPWNGHYYGGYHHHHGSDWGLALGGLAIGTIIGGALAQPYYGPYNNGYYGSPYGYGGPYSYYRPYRQYEPSLAYEGGSHVSWCYARYRTYRAFDNTFQPFYGPRRECVGPYGWR